MFRPRIIPCLTLINDKLVKTTKFKEPKYLGDPINAVKVFNEKEVDELILLDIRASIEKRDPNYELIRDIATECFIPFGYGGGIRTLEQGKKLIRNGSEKVILNSASTNFDLIKDLSDHIGSQGVIACIDVKSGFRGKYIATLKSGTQKLNANPIDLAKQLVEAGVGEILINSIDRDGTMAGYDLTIAKKITETVNVPVVICGGASSLLNMKEAIMNAGVSATSAGSLFVFHGPHRSVLLNYPSQEEIKRVLN